MVARGAKGERWWQTLRGIVDARVARLRALREEGRFDEAVRLLPVERPYPTPADIRAILGMDER